MRERSCLVDATLENAVWAGSVACKLEQVMLVTDRVNGVEIASTWLFFARMTSVEPISPAAAIWDVLQKRRHRTVLLSRLRWSAAERSPLFMRLCRTSENAAAENWLLHTNITNSELCVQSPL